MHLRQELIALFSTFVQFEDDRFSSWATDARLRRHMQQYLSTQRLSMQHLSVQNLSVQNLSVQNFSTPGQNRDLSHSDLSHSEGEWTLYWHQRWVQSDSPSSNSLPLGHLTAYLQESCYWAASQTLRKVANVPLAAQYGLSDYFQIAIAKVETVLKQFNPDRGTRLKNFAHLAFSSLLRDYLRQRQDVALCTNLGLLRRTSKKRFLEALEQVGLSSGEIAQYRLAWTCFNALYDRSLQNPSQSVSLPSAQAPSGIQQFSNLDPELSLAISQLYNRERHSQIDRTAPECQPETLERWLNQCAAWVRSYLYPSVESLNRPLLGEETDTDFQESLADPQGESFLAALIAQEDLQERQRQREHLHQAIATRLATLEPQSQEILRLYYQQGLTQQQMMQYLQMSQATVSRRLTKARETLLLKIVEWSQEQLNISPTPNLIKDMSAALEEWLGVYYGQPNPVSSSPSAGKERVS
ncbi:sigma-70 family RNA polymerase sigma factor [Alkalinema sp. FACHB-956]|uniref:sigma-70 family RNA polymerase sigma factor n=1 Tax=Alkalinema sp. FACHB-956 TaxID=2692768 RepID=UPI001688BF07|nr:sigma-70 family RNA polymerase sigma factor [Alkalinema sp. FACHB-956]MBD2328728.1 sigma-70 family RNA polymerase sigma factor [Alkalinema sp. FACHB-956]